MTSTPDVELRHYTDVDEAWETVISVYADIRAPLLHLPHYSVARFGERLSRHGAEPGWEAVIGWDQGEPAAFIYANSINADDRWWARMNTPLPTGITARPTVAVKELMVRDPWRKTGLSRQLHDSLLAGRSEEQVTLMVNPEAGDGKVMAIYSGWGYREVSYTQPSPDSPRLVAMIRAAHALV
jgi:hypothetical protein